MLHLAYAPGSVALGLGLRVHGHGPGGPDEGGLAVEVAGGFFAGEVVVEHLGAGAGADSLGGFVGADADIADFAVGAQVGGEGLPGAFGGFFVGGFIEPAVTDAHGHGEDEHAGARGFIPVLGAVDVDELAPHAVFVLEFEEACHHFFVAIEDGGAVGMIIGEDGEEFGHADGEPAVAAAPVVGGVGGMEEEAVGLLEGFEVGEDFFGVAIAVGFVAGDAVGLSLERGDHEHVIDPVTVEGGEAVGAEAGPFGVGGFFAEVEPAFVFGLGAVLAVEFHGEDAEDGVIDVVGGGDEIGAGGEEDFVAFGEFVEAVLVLDLAGEAGAAVGGADLAVVHAAAGDVGLGEFTGEEVIDDFFAEGDGVGFFVPFAPVGGDAAGGGDGGGGGRVCGERGLGGGTEGEGEDGAGEEARERGCHGDLRGFCGFVVFAARRKVVPRCAMGRRGPYWQRLHGCGIAGNRVVRHAFFRKCR